MRGGILQLRLTQHISLRAYALALRDIVPFGRNVVYAGNAIQNWQTPEVNIESNHVDLSAAPGLKN